MDINKKTLYDLRRINNILNNYQTAEYPFVSSRLAWLLRYKKAPLDVLNAFIYKATAIFKNQWYGDEQEQLIIDNFLKNPLMSR